MLEIQKQVHSQILVFIVQIMEAHSQLISIVECQSVEMEESMLQNNVKMEEQQLEMGEMITE